MARFLEGKGLATLEPLAMHMHINDAYEQAQLSPNPACGRFLEGEGPAADKRRNHRFKLIPSILKSPWVVKQAVGTTPVLLGNKLVTKYFRCENWGRKASLIISG